MKWAIAGMIVLLLLMITGVLYACIVVGKRLDMQMEEYFSEEETKEGK